MNKNKIFSFEYKIDFLKVIMEILKNNGVEEGLEEYFEKKRQGQNPYIKTLYKSVEDMVIGNKTDNEFLSIIKKEINVSDDVAKNILKEVKEKIVPVVRELSEEEIVKDEEAPESFIQRAPDISVEENAKAIEKDRGPTVERKTPIIKTEATDMPKIKEDILPKEAVTVEDEKSKLPKKPITPRKPKSSGSDKYREPIA